MTVSQEGGRECSHITQYFSYLLSGVSGVVDAELPKGERKAFEKILKGTYEGTPLILLRPAKAFWVDLVLMAPLRPDWTVIGSDGRTEDDPFVWDGFLETGEEVTCKLKLNDGRIELSRVKAERYSRKVTRRRMFGEMDPFQESRMLVGLKFRLPDEAQEESERALVSQRLRPQE